MRHPLSLEAFADWCEKQPTTGAYIWHDACNCACGQYAKSLGLMDMWMDGPNAGPFWDKADLIAKRGVRQFGALASRLRASIQEA